MERRLAAILAADVVGYSRLMEADEAGTHGRLRALRKDFIEAEIGEHHGRLVKLMGDGVLVEFASAVDAVTCAAAIQKGVAGRQADVREDQRITLRIGINIGDIITEDDDIYGEGVNVAARLEALAEPGGICIARNVFNQVKNKIALGFEPMGEHRVKNIAEPITVYRVLPDPSSVAQAIGLKRAGTTRWRWLASTSAIVLLLVAATTTLWLRPWTPSAEVAVLEGVALPLPEKPSIAVLPFDNMSGDVEQDYFADGIAEDLITDLSKLSSLFVIARDSSFSYKDEQVKVPQVAEELGVRYVLEGSVRRAGDRVRINAQLIDATTGGHLWAERYDGTLEDIFGLQDQVTRRIVAALAVELTDEEQAQQARLETASAAAHDAFLKGWSLYRRKTPHAFVEAIDHLERATQLDSGYSRAYAALAALYSDANELRWASQMGINTDWIWWNSNRYLDLALRDPTPLAYVLNAHRLRKMNKHEAAIDEARQAVILDPNDPDGYLGLGLELTYSGQPETAIPLIEKAKRLDPRNPSRYAEALGLALLGMDQLEEAAGFFEDSVDAYPNRYPLWALLAVANGHLGQSAEAAETVKRLKETWGALKAGPFRLRSVMNYFERQNFKRESDLERIADGLRKAGVPD